MNKKPIIYKLEKLNKIKPLILNMSQIVDICNDGTDFTDILRDILGDPNDIILNSYSFERSHDLDIDTEIQKLITKIYKKQHEEKDKEQITNTRYILRSYVINHREKVTLTWYKIEWHRIDSSIIETINSMYAENIKWRDYDIYQFSEEQTYKEKPKTSLQQKAEMGKVGARRKYSSSDFDKLGIF